MKANIVNMAGLGKCFVYLFLLSLAAYFLSNTGEGSSAEYQQQATGCRKIDKNHEVVYLELAEKQSAEKERQHERTVLLRISNNTTCEVKLISPQDQFRFVNGELTSALDEGEKVDIFYEVESKERRLRHYKNDSLYYIRLLPGRSCVFPVLSSYLRKNNVICVPYRYSWEESPVFASTPRCEALFFARSLPRERGKG